jgi:hypothetical protein
MNSEGTTARSEDVATRELFHRITDDVRTIARDEIELVRAEMGQVAKRVAAEGAAVMFGGIVALIGLSMLCVAAVVALAPLIASLALRLVLMAVVYGVIGGVLAVTFAVRLRRDAIPNLAVPVHELKATIEGAKETIKERGGQIHA